MRTVLLEPTAEIESWLAERRKAGQDRFDEVWDGEYHVAPSPHFSHGDIGGQLFDLLRSAAKRAGLRGATSFNLGESGNYRVPDAGYVRGRPSHTYVATAALVIEVVSPRDETWAKFDFYFTHGVDELLIVDPASRTVQWFARGETGFEARPVSDLLGITAEQLTADLDWPPTD